MQGPPAPRGELRNDPADDPAYLAARLEAVTAAAALAFPDVAALAGPGNAERLARALGERMTLDEITDERAAELALALLCAQNDVSALLALERSYMLPARNGLAPMKLDAALLDDVMQETRRRLLVAEEGPARIMQYAGTGKLRGLIQVVASRVALDELRRVGRAGESPEPDRAEELADAQADPALLYLRAHAGEAFRQAFRAAVTSLSPHERNLLHLHHMKGVTLDKLGTMYRVHRATIVRQLADVRRKLVVETERALRSTLGSGSPALASMLGLLGSQLDASVQVLLGDSSP